LILNLGPQPWVARSGPSLTILGYGDVDADALRQAAGLYAEPGLSAAIIDVQTKQMPIVSTGMEVGFRIRVRPVARRRDENGHVFEQDIAIGADDRAAAYRDWLAAQLQDAVNILRCELEQFQLVRSSRRRAGVVKRMPGWHPDAVLTGTLRIVDEAAFSRSIRKGVGRHKAFGYGALLLRSARTDA
jgi:CRISPR system Cascade subunit CasE